MMSSTLLSWSLEVEQLNPSPCLHPPECRSVLDRSPEKGIQFSVSVEPVNLNINQFRTPADDTSQVKSLNQMSKESFQDKHPDILSCLILFSVSGLKSAEYLIVQIFFIPKCF